MRSSTTSLRREPTRYCLAGGFAVAIALASLLDPSGGVDALLVDLGPLGIARGDKWIHALSYGGLAALIALAVRSRDRRVLAGTLIAVVAFGGVVELMQGPVPWRTKESTDILANAFGAVWGLAGWRIAEGEQFPSVGRFLGE